MRNRDSWRRWILAVAFMAAVAWGPADGWHALAEVRNPKGLAVVIGNSDYRSKDIPPVDYAGRDAEAFKRYVIDVLGFDPANVIHMKNATRREMLDVLGDPAAAMNDVQARLNILGGNGESEVVVYYSGHGVPGQKGKPFLLPVDVPPHAARTEGYPIDLLYTMLGRLRGAKSVWVFLDTCFSGSSHAGRLVTGSPVYQETAFPENVAERMMVMTAVTKTQIATWDKDAKHGLFTRHLLDALYGKGDRDGNGNVTAAEAKEYLDRHMTAAAWLSDRREQQATLRGTVGAVLARAAAGGFAARPGFKAGSVSPAPPGGASDTVKDSAPPPSDHATAEAALGLNRGVRVLVQRGLGSLEFDAGPADGLFGKKTRGAIKGWQEAKGFEGTGYLTAEQAEALRAAGEEVKVAVGINRKPKETVKKGWKAGEVFKDCAECPEMVVIPAGEFMMGSPDWEGGRQDDEGPHHRVRIGEAYAVGKYEVTFEEWDACVTGGGCRSYRPGDEGWGRGRRPVVNVSWEDVKAYVGWLSDKTGKGYRLLSEAEWEYAARAGTRGPFHFGGTISAGQANYDGNYTYGSGVKGPYRERTERVGSFGPNGFGLHDVHGNVWEWVEDCWYGNYGGAPVDGSAWVSGGDCEERVLRGGSWDYVPGFLRSAFRFRNSPGIRNSSGGFRIARTLIP